MLRSLVGSEMCIRDRYQRRVRGSVCCAWKALAGRGMENETSQSQAAQPPYRVEVVHARVRPADNTAYYEVRVTHIPDSASWSVHRRYRDFDNLRQVLEAGAGSAIKDFPRKHLLRSKWQGVMAQRSKDFTRFLHEWALPACMDRLVRAFLQLDRATVAVRPPTPAAPEAIQANTREPLSCQHEDETPVSSVAKRGTLEFPGIITPHGREACEALLLAWSSPVLDPLEMPDQESGLDLALTLCDGCGADVEQCVCRPVIEDPSQHQAHQSDQTTGGGGGRVADV
eukprot:TRINITY_DN15382_c0_g1_i1.p1 TRINITY_DN15382_c0_g1~~TRINITY_DN15382_c0_g1_i1.p1  ORF type:complete len:328 (+),score=55.97 TRINITY_DN15382_c0_g1_i1:133-984(+)